LDRQQGCHYRVIEPKKERGTQTLSTLREGGVNSRTPETVIHGRRSGSGNLRSVKDLKKLLPGRFNITGPKAPLGEGGKNRGSPTPRDFER